MSSFYARTHRLDTFTNGENRKWPSALAPSLIQTGFVLCYWLPDKNIIIINSFFFYLFKRWHLNSLFSWRNMVVIQTSKGQRSGSLLSWTESELAKNFRPQACRSARIRTVHQQWDIDITAWCDVVLLCNSVVVVEVVVIVVVVVVVVPNIFNTNLSDTCAYFC